MTDTRTGTDTATDRRNPTRKDATAGNHATARESRQVAEAAREEGWRKPGFAKELFLGRFRLDLIHPHPQPDSVETAKAEKFGRYAWQEAGALDLAGGLPWIAEYEARSSAVPDVHRKIT